MRSAQDEAFRNLLAQRGVDQVAVQRAEGQDPSASLVTSVVRSRVVPPQVASGLLRELAQGSFVCQGCGQALAYDALSFLEVLRCPRCQSPLEFRREAPPPLGLEHGAPSVPRQTLARRGSAVGKTIGPYKLLEELGRGSNGVVFLAAREGLERRFALKVLLSTSFDDAEAIARFKLEAAVASKLDETGVIGVYDVGRDGEHYYYAMEYCPGITLQDVIARGPLPPERAARLVSQLAHTVAHAHDMGVIHRDLKPANVILDERTKLPRITDFGLARAPDLAGSLTKTGDVLGTPYYMAPEQLRGGAEVEPSIDTYALGVILYECLTGQRPFEARTVLDLSRLVQEAQPAPIGSLVEGVPDELEAVCRRAMAKRPWARYRSALALGEDLDRFLAGEIPQAALEAPGRKAVVADDPEGRRGGALIALAVVLLLAASGAVAFLAVRRGSAPPSPSPLASAPPATPTQDPELLLAPLRQAALAGAATDELLEEADRLERQLAGDPAGLRALHLLRAEVLLRRARYADCLKVLEQIEPGTGEEDLRRLWAKGSAHERLQHKGEALQSYDALREYDPRGAWGLAAASAASRLRGSLPEALQYARAAHDRDPENVPGLLELGQLVVLVDKDRDYGVELLQRALRLCPDHTRLLMGLALLLGDQPDTMREALTYLDRVLELTGGEHARARLLRAALRIRVGEEEGARKDVEVLLERDPRQVEALFLRGMLRWRSGAHAEAKSDWELAYEVDPRNFCLRLNDWPYPADRVHLQQALHLDDEGRRRKGELLQVSDELRARLAKRAVWAGEEASAPLTEALVKAAAGYPWSEIEPYFKAAVEAAPRSRVVALEQARVLVGREEYELALAEIKRARELGADAAELTRLEGEVWWTRGKRHVAVEYWDRLAQEDHGVEGLCAGARTFAVRQNEEQAWKAVKAALELEPEHTPSLIAKGMLLISDEVPPEKLEQNRAELKQTIDKILGLEGYLNAQIFHLRLDLALADLVKGDKQLRERDEPMIDKALELYQDWRLMSSGVTPVLMAAQLALPIPKDSYRNRAKRWIAEAVALDPERGGPLMYMGVVTLLEPHRKVTEDEVLDYWKRAKAVEPMITMPKDWREVYKQRFKDTTRLDALKIPIRNN